MQFYTALKCQQLQPKVFLFMIPIGHVLNEWITYILLGYTRCPTTRLKSLKRLYLVQLKFVLKLIQKLILLRINIHTSSTIILKNLCYLSTFLCNDLKPETIYSNIFNNLNYSRNP